MNVHSLVDPWIDAVSIGAAMALAPTRRGPDPVVLELQHAVQIRNQYIAQLQSMVQQRDSRIASLESDLELATYMWERYKKDYWAQVDKSRIP